MKKIKNLLVWVFLATSMFVMVACDGANKDKVELSFIEISGTFNKIYTVGQNFDASGMLVTATYSDKSTKEVTTFTTDKTGYDKFVLTDISITVSYTENDVTKTVVVTGIVVTEGVHQNSYAQLVTKINTAMKLAETSNAFADLNPEAVAYLVENFGDIFATATEKAGISCEDAETLFVGLVSLISVENEDEAFGMRIGLVSEISSFNTTQAIYFTYEMIHGLKDFIPLLGDAELTAIYDELVSMKKDEFVSVFEAIAFVMSFAISEYSEITQIMANPNFTPNMLAPVILGIRDALLSTMQEITEEDVIAITELANVIMRMIAMENINMPVVITTDMVELGMALINSILIHIDVIVLNTFLTGELNENVTSIFVAKVVKDTFLEEEFIVLTLLMYGADEENAVTMSAFADMVYDEIVWISALDYGDQITDAQEYNEEEFLFPYWLYSIMLMLTVEPE